MLAVHYTGCLHCKYRKCNMTEHVLIVNNGIWELPDISVRKVWSLWKVPASLVNWRILYLKAVSFHLTSEETSSTFLYECHKSQCVWVFSSKSVLSSSSARFYSPWSNTLRSNSITRMNTRGGAMPLVGSSLSPQHLWFLCGCCISWSSPQEH